jgi:hypothetical protein
MGSFPNWGALLQLNWENAIIPTPSAISMERFLVIVSSQTRLLSSLYPALTRFSYVRAHSITSRVMKFKTLKRKNG